MSPIQLISSVIDVFDPQRVHSHNPRLVELVDPNLCDRDISDDDLECYKQILFEHRLIRESFATKLSRVKVTYFDLWFKCVDYQRSSGRGKADKKSAVVVTLLQLSVEERRALVGVGISRLKESAFAEFKTEFAAFVKDAARRRRKIQVSLRRNLWDIGCKNLIIFQKLIFN